MPSLRITFALLATACAVVAQSTTECPELHLILGRGTSEELGDGRLESIAGALVDRFPGTTVFDVPYPATEQNPAYVESALYGTIILRNALLEHIERCPQSKIAFLGYSQGGHIGTNLLCGSSDFWAQGQFPVEPLDKSLIEDNIIAIVTFGDPSHRQNSFSRGTATLGNGVFNRHDTVACEAYGDAIASYCDIGDSLCDVTQRNQEGAHQAYIDTYGEEVVEWISERFTTGEGALPQTPTEPCRRRH